LERLHPESLSILAGLSVGDESEAVLAVAMLLERLTAIREGDTQAPLLVTLADRGFNEPELARLATLVSTAQRATLPVGVSVAAVAHKAEEDSTDAARLALYRWFVDWSTTAKTFVKRKDWLIRMGLSQRRRKRGGEE
jgi:hypothetical protein